MSDGLKTASETDESSVEETPVVAEVEKKVRKKRKQKGITVKDPNPPKRPKGTYMLFSMDERAKYKEAHPESKTYPDSTKVISEKWNAMTEEEKQSYTDRAAELREEYNKELAARPKPPKKPQTAYTLFSSTKREQIKKENPEVTFSEMAKILGALWKETPQEEKAKFVEAAKNEKEGYAVAFAKFKEEYPDWIVEATDE